MADVAAGSDFQLAQARLGLVTRIRGAFTGCLLVALISYFVSRRLPPFARRKQSP